MPRSAIVLLLDLRPDMRQVVPLLGRRRRLRCLLQYHLQLVLLVLLLQLLDLLLELLDLFLLVMDLRTLLQDLRLLPLDRLRLLLLAELQLPTLGRDIGGALVHPYDFLLQVLDELLTALPLALHLLPVRLLPLGVEERGSGLFGLR